MYDCLLNLSIQTGSRLVYIETYIKKAEHTFLRKIQEGKQLILYKKEEQMLDYNARHMLNNKQLITN